MSHPFFQRSLTLGVMLALSTGPALAQSQAAKTGTGQSRSPAGVASGQSSGAAGTAAASGTSGGLSIGALAAGVAAAAAVGTLAVIAVDPKDSGSGVSGAAATAGGGGTSTQ